MVQARIQVEHVRQEVPPPVGMSEKYFGSQVRPREPVHERERKADCDQTQNPRRHPYEWPIRVSIRITPLLRQLARRPPC